MHVEVEYGNMRAVDQLLGIKIVPNPYVPRPGAIVDITQRWLYVHPDEEHMVWAGLGFIDESFYKLNRSVERQVSRRAKHAEERLRVKTPTEIRNEISDRIADQRFAMRY